MGFFSLFFSLFLRVCGSSKYQVQLQMVKNSRPATVGAARGLLHGQMCGEAPGQATQVPGIVLFPSRQVWDSGGGFRRPEALTFGPLERTPWTWSLVFSPHASTQLLHTLLRVSPLSLHEPCARGRETPSRETGRPGTFSGALAILFFHW